MRDLIEVALLAVLLWWVLSHVPTKRVPPPTVDYQQASYGGWRQSWCDDLRGRTGRPLPVCEEWTVLEDVGEGAHIRNNPLNTSMPMDCQTQVFNGDGVRGYDSYECGMTATVMTLRNGLYDGILGAESREEMIEAILGSRWCSGDCYSAWRNP